MLNFTLTNVVQLTLGIDLTGFKITQNNFQNKNRARHLFDGTDVQLGAYHF